MKTQFDIEKVVQNGKIQNELDYERALIADRKLRTLSKENPKLKSLRKRLRDAIEKYENANWTTSKLDAAIWQESDLAELIAEKEGQFLSRRKQLIKEKLKKLGLSQQNLMTLLGHTSKTYMSELINGIAPFTLNDLIVIHRLLKIELTDLIPTTINYQRRNQIQKSIEEIGAGKIKLGAEDFDLAF